MGGRLEKERSCAMFFFLCVLCACNDVQKRGIPESHDWSSFSHQHVDFGLYPTSTCVTGIKKMTNDEFLAGTLKTSPKQPWAHFWTSILDEMASAAKFETPKLLPNSSVPEQDQVETGGATCTRWAIVQTLCQSTCRNSRWFLQWIVSLPNAEKV